MSDPHNSKHHQKRPLLQQASSAAAAAAAAPEEVIEASAPRSSSSAPVEEIQPPQEQAPLAGHQQQQQQQPEQALPPAGETEVVASRKLNIMRAWQRLQKSTKRIVMGPRPDLGRADGEGAADARAVVLNMEGAGAAVAEDNEEEVVGENEELQRLAQRSVGVSSSRHRTVKSMMDMPPPSVISEEAEQGLELLAHAVVADAREARAEAASVRAAAADHYDDDHGHGLRLGVESPRVSLSSDHPDMLLGQSPRTLEGMLLPSTVNATCALPEGTLGETGALPGGEPTARSSSVRGKRGQQPALSHVHAHQGRKAVIMAKQQLVRTLTLSKHGETVEMQLPVKELLRYIQNAVRTVHISHGQYNSQQSVGLGTSLGKDKDKDKESGAGGPVLQRSTQPSRTYSQGNVGPSVAAGSTRVAPPAQLGGLLNARDVRRLISGLDTESVKSKEMSILVRRHTVALNLDIIRCLVLWDRLIVVVPEGADSHCLDHLEENLRWLRMQQRAFDMDEDEDDDEDFEFLALEAVLMTVCNQLKSTLKDLRPLIIKNAKALLGTGTLNTKHQDALRQLKSKVASAQSKVRSLHRALFDLLDDEEHLQMLHLTRIYTQQQQQLLLLGAAGAGNEVDGAGFAVVEADRDDEAEVLLESFLQDCSELVGKWELVKEDMNNTENYCLMQLDMARNRLLTIGTIFALINLCFAFGAVVAGVFGMNLFNGVSEGSGSPDSFGFFISTVGVTLGIMIVGGGTTLLWMHQSRILVA